ncbi:MAG: sodium:calcium antiporter, partial [Salinigranum sp.]
MVGLLASTGLFVVGLVALLKASDAFTDAAERVGLAAGLSPFIVGTTIVAVGTSLPELVASVL